MAKVVVGVDGSPSSVDAARWAARAAKLQSAPLHVVCVYGSDGVSIPMFLASESGVAGFEAAEVPSPLAGDEAVMLKRKQQLEDARRARAEETIDQVLGQVAKDLEGVKVSREVVADRHPAGVLIEESRDADLLVVGRRGLGGFEALLLGSVSRACVEHARCPVAVMPPAT